MNKINLPRTPDGKIDFGILWTESSCQHCGDSNSTLYDLLISIHEDGQRVGAEKMREQVERSLAVTSHEWSGHCADLISRLEIEP